MRFLLTTAFAGFHPRLASPMRLCQLSPPFTWSYPSEFDLHEMAQAQGEA